MSHKNLPLALCSGTIPLPQKPPILPRTPARGLNLTAKESDFFMSGRTGAGGGGAPGSEVDGTSTGGHDLTGSGTTATGRCRRDAHVPDKDSGARGRVLRPLDSRALPRKDAGPSGAMSPGYRKDVQCSIRAHCAFHFPLKKGTQTPAANFKLPLCRHFKSQTENSVRSN